MAEAVGAYRDLFGIIAEAKKAQVDALNAQGFSVDEYTWVKTRVYEAAGVTVTGVDFREMAGKLQSGDVDALRNMVTNAGAAAAGRTTAEATADATKPIATDAPGVGIPDANKALVAPYKDKAATWMMYGAFGL